MTNIINIKVTGTRPLLVSSSEGVVLTTKEGHRLRELNSMRKLTDADKEERDQLKYEIALYHDARVGPYLPSINLWASARDAGALNKLKGKFAQGVQMVGDEMLPLEYEGPRDIQGLYNDKRFVDIRAGRLNGKTSIPVIRPIFHRWAVKTAFIVNDSAISVADAKRAFKLAGEFIGVGTYRQRFGRFDVVFS